MKLTHTFSLLLLALVACGESEEPAQETPTEPTAEEAPAAEAAPAVPESTLTEEQLARATEVAAEATGRGFPSAISRDKELAPVMLHLAGHGETEDVVISALLTLSQSWTVVPGQVERGSTMVDDNFVAVVLSKLSDSNPSVQAAAIKAAGIGFRRGHVNEPLLEACLNLAGGSESPQVDFAVINQIWQASDALTTPERLTIFTEALASDQPWLVSSALWRASSIIPRDEAIATPFQAKALELTRHADPGVRGRAAELLATLAGRLGETDESRVAATARLVEMLDDDNPYTKSAAMSAQRTLRNVSSLHKIVTFLEDDTSNTHDIRFEALGGGSDRVHHDGSAWSEVRDAALYTIKSLSSQVDRENRFDYTINGGTSDADLATAATEAQAWYRSHRSDIPEG